MPHCDIKISGFSYKLLILNLYRQLIFFLEANPPTFNEAYVFAPAIYSLYQHVRFQGVIATCIAEKTRICTAWQSVRVALCEVCSFFKRRYCRLFAIYRANCDNCVHYIGLAAKSRNRRSDWRCSHLSRFGRQLQCGGTSRNWAKESQRKKGVVSVSGLISDADEPPGNQFKVEMQNIRSRGVAVNLCTPTSHAMRLIIPVFFFLLRCISLQPWFFLAHGALNWIEETYSFLWYKWRELVPPKWFYMPIFA